MTALEPAPCYCGSTQKSSFDNSCADCGGELYQAAKRDAKEAEAYATALEADLRTAKISEAFWRDGWFALDRDKRIAEAKLAELLVVAKRAVRLSLDHADFKLYAMEPMHQAIAAAELKGDKT